MRVTGIDERRLVQERTGASFVVFTYRGGDAGRSWAVDSHLLFDADLPQVLKWLRQNLPTETCWSVGVVLEPERPTAESDLKVAWIVGADVLNSEPRDRDPEDQRLAEEMMTRRHRVNLP